MDAFYSHVRLDGGEVAPPHPRVGDGVKWAKSAIRAHSASQPLRKWKTAIENNNARAEVIKSPVQFTYAESW